MTQALGYVAKRKRGTLKPTKFERREPENDDVEIAVLFCGVCHSDLHQVRNEWSNTIYPCMPGHEIVGRVSRIGSAVVAHRVGDLVGVGCMVDSCGSCAGCKSGLEQYCEGPKGATLTYNGPMKPDGTNTFGGYSDRIVVRERFVLKIPPGLSPEAAAPLLCAGITTWSPLRHWKVGPGSRVAIVGLGGLGHLAVQLAAALGAEVTAFTTTPQKEEEARRYGARRTVVWKTDADLAAHELAFDLVLNTMPDPYDANPFVKMVARDGTLVVCGMLGAFTLPIDNSEVAFHRRQIAGTLIGGLPETQEVLNFCADNGIAPAIERVAIQDIEEAFDKMQDGEVRYRFVIDMASIERDR